MTRVLHVLEKKLFQFCCKCFLFMKELKSAILSKNHRRSQRGGPRGPGSLNRNATNDKNLTKKSCFFIFSFF